MVNFSNIQEFTIDPPKVWTCLGSYEDYEELSEEHKDQIKFLDPKAEEFLYNFFELSMFHTGPIWEPFEKGNFKHVEKISLLEVDVNSLKKWLFKRGIPFSKWVYVLPNYGRTFVNDLENGG